MYSYIKRAFIPSIVPKPRSPENSEFHVDKFGLLHYLHHRSEGHELVSENIESLLPEGGGVLLEIGIIVFEGIGKVLHGVSRPVRIVLFQQAAHAVVVEQAGGDDPGDVLLFHPFHPAVFDGYGYLV